MGVSCSAVTDRCRRRPLATLAWALGAAVAVGACGAQTGGNTTGTGGAGGSGPSCPTGGGTTTLPRSLDCLAPQFTANGALVGSFRPLLSPCAGDGSCPGDQVCFHLTSEIALCDVPQQAPTDAVCEPACDVGHRCNPGFTGGTPCVPHTNYCSETSCASASDCGDGMVCAPPSLIHIGPLWPRAMPAPSLHLRPGLHERTERPLCPRRKLDVRGDLQWPGARRCERLLRLLGLTRGSERVRGGVGVRGWMLPQLPVTAA
jgi:hypothetical protein